MATSPNLARALAAMQTAQRSSGGGQTLQERADAGKLELDEYQRNNPDVQREQGKYDALMRAKDAARGFSPTTRMSSGGGTTSPRPDPIMGDYGAQADTPTTQGPKRTGDGNRLGLQMALQQLALSPYQQDLRVTGRTRRPDPFYGPMDGILSQGIQELAGRFGLGPQAPKYDYQTEPVFKSPMAEVAYNYYNPYGVLFSDPVRTDTYPYYAARPEMIPTMNPDGTRSGTFQGY
tara:strand:- start:5150 stop:5851 length:702 start_codon:yes stop_codon:yes gene_type:complete